MRCNAPMLGGGRRRRGSGLELSRRERLSRPPNGWGNGRRHRSINHKPLEAWESVGGARSAHHHSAEWGGLGNVMTLLTVPNHVKHSYSATTYKYSSIRLRILGFVHGRTHFSAG